MRGVTRVDMGERGDCQRVRGGASPLPAGAVSRDILTRQEAADRLGVSLRTIDRMRAAGEVAVVTIRRRVFIPMAEVRRIVASATRNTSRADIRHPGGLVVDGPLW